MKSRVKLVSAEVAAPGHPDKIADQIADAIVDAMVEQHPQGRCGCEVLVNAQFVVVSGEFKTHAQLDVPKLVKDTVRSIGYTDSRLGFTADQCAVIVSVREQSPEISAVIEKGGGASDQGIMYGYACDETPEFMPLSVQLARQMMVRLNSLRHERVLPYLRPDGKTQVTVAYPYDGSEPYVASVVVAAQHDPELPIEEVRQDVLERVIQPVIPKSLWHDDLQVVINKLGRFVLGGPAIDTGVTGRKIVADTYGGVGRIGGGALCGKDPTKLDRTGAYYGRYIAKNLVAAGLAKKCQIELAYAFGEVDPVATSIDTFGTGILPEDKLLELLQDNFHFRPADMIYDLDLCRPIYRETAAFGHFGLSNFPWEKTDIAPRLRESAQQLV